MDSTTYNPTYKPGADSPRKSYLYPLIKIITHRITIGILLSAGSFIGGLYLYRLFYQSLQKYWSIRLLSSASVWENVELILYLLSLTIIPFVLLMLWHYLPIHTLKRKLISSLVFAISIFLSIWLCITTVRMQVDEMQAKFRDKTPLIPDHFPARFIYHEQLHLWLYITGALLVSSAISYFLLREKDRGVPAFSFEHGLPADSAKD